MRRIALLLLLAVGCATLRSVPSKNSDEFVHVQDDMLVLDEKPARFLGVNTYSLASRVPPMFACGRVYTDAEVTRTLEELAAMVPQGFVPAIRIWMFREFIGAQRDWSRFDRIFAEARRTGVRVIATLDNHWGHCAGEKARTGEWYRTGYRRPSGDGMPSQWEFVRDAARRYRNEPTLLMWQVVNEGQSDDAAALYDYAADLSSVLKRNDPNHLVSFGTIGDDQQRGGAEGSSYARLHQLPSIDIVESHEYPDYDTSASFWPEAPLRNCLTVAETYGKPCMIGEIGITAHTPEERAWRAWMVTARIRLLFREGVQVVLIWSYRAGDWQKDFDPTDPLYDLIKKGPLE